MNENENIQKPESTFSCNAGETMALSRTQMEQVKRRIDYYDKNPHELVSWDEVRKRLKFG